ncbi:protein of unknown function [Rhodovastum atsumiense]|nr:protein of unknown function [Rhodovastum atsumiense]
MTGCLVFRREAGADRPRKFNPRKFKAGWKLPAGRRDPGGEDIALTCVARKQQYFSCL